MSLGSSQDASGTNVVEMIRFCEQRDPQRTALRWAGNSIGYQQMMRRVDGLAARLQREGVGPGARVGVLLRRSPEMIVGILGVMAAGAAYVPLDPESPMERLAHIIADSAPALILTDTDVTAPFDRPSTRTLHTADWEQDGKPSDLRGEVAYVIYTSGSTGRPKGVVIGHEALANYVRWCRENLNFSGGGVPLFGSIAYDHVITSLFPPLCAGEHLQLLGPIQSGHRLLDELQSGLRGTGGRFSYLKVTPSHLRILPRDDRALVGSTTEMVIFGGERLTAELVAEVRRDAPALRVMNHYGPTEATVGCCTYDVPVPFDGEDVPIGRPITGAVATVRDEHGQVCETGHIGELHIGGKGLAVGYFGRPSETEAAFITARKHDGTAVRWYRTGDLVYSNDRGNYVFCGRRDDQLKILGHRIEPKEIEDALCLHPKVSTAAVFGLKGDHAVELVALVVTTADLSENEVRSYLRQRLPHSMVPTHVVLSNVLPTNKNGKLDRDAIARSLVRRDAVDIDVEGATLSKWREVLQNEAIELEDDFFELGGDSICAMEISMWANSFFGVPLEPTAVFEFSSPAAFSEHVRSLLVPR